ncbi:hypothetical protein [Sorangium sp. So ce394]|uniref:hypothetical protein n=1 Tax=Sorangium sp. So ce394 TaxID=3133310 RepID=UPI003F5B6058
MTTLPKNRHAMFGSILAIATVGLFALGSGCSTAPSDSAGAEEVGEADDDLSILQCLLYEINGKTTICHATNSRRHAELRLLHRSRDLRRRRHGQRLRLHADHVRGPGRDLRHHPRRLRRHAHLRRALRPRLPLRREPGLGGRAGRDDRERRTVHELLLPRSLPHFGRLFLGSLR